MLNLIKIPLKLDEKIKRDNDICEIAFELKEGENIYQTKKLKLGIFNDKSLFLSINFWYNYVTEKKTITISGNSDTSEKQLQLSLFFDKDNEPLCYTINKNLDILESKNENFNDIENTFNPIAIAINDEIINTLVKNEIIVQIITPSPVVDNETDAEEIISMFESNKNIDLNEDKILLANHLIKSTWGGEVTFNYNEDFANVIGSTPDPKIAGNSWLKLWRDNCNNGYDPTHCSSDGFPNGFTCSGGFVGGHVITGQNASPVIAGSNNVYIFPICIAHNNNDKIYMKSKYNPKGVWLNNYMQ